MEQNKAIIIIPDDSTMVWSYAKNIKESAASAGFGMTIKTESQLLKTDLDSTLWIIGPIADYSHWDRFGIPIEKLRHGFKIGKFSFKEPSYGFSYASPTGFSPFRLVTSGNSLNAYEKVNNMPYSSFGFEYVVLNNAVPELIGDSSHIVDLGALKKSLYISRKSKYYDFMISKNLNSEDLEKVNDVEMEKCDKQIEAFAKKLELSLPKNKIKTYIHATQDEIKYFSGVFGALCGGTVNGFATGDDEIHSWKWENVGIIEHESIHHLFNPQVNKMPVTFLSEGVPTWYNYTMHAEEKERGFQQAIELIDHDLTDVICGKENFYQGDKYYLISGIFMDYLINTYGLNKFKELYKYNTRDILSGFEKTYGKSLSEILVEYKNWLLSKVSDKNLNQ